MKLSRLSQKNYRNTPRITVRYRAQNQIILQRSHKIKTQIQKTSLPKQIYQCNQVSLLHIQQRNFFQTLGIRRNVCTSRHSDIQFSLKNPKEKVIKYTDLVASNYNESLRGRPAIRFYVEHIICPIKYGIHSKNNIFHDYRKVFDPGFEINDEPLTNLSRMDCLYPMLYSEMVNPVRFQTYRLKNYSFYDGIINLHRYLINRETIKDSSEKNINRNIFSHEMEIVFANLNAQNRFIKKLSNINYEKLNPEKYIKFLALVKNDMEITPEKLILPNHMPNYEIGLFWHAHILDPECYQKDCAINFGTLFEHDDTKDSKMLNEKCEKTRNAWFKMYGYDF